MPSYIGPYGFIFYRVFVSLILFLAVYLLFLRETVAKSDWLRLFFCGLFGIAINQLLFFKGISLTSSVNAALLMITSPIITYLLTQLLLKNKLENQKIAGIILGMAGASALIIASAKELTSAHAFGDLCVILNAISFSIYLIIVKPLTRKYHPLTITFFVFLTGSIWVGIFGWKQAAEVQFADWSMVNYYSFGFVVFGATFLVYLFNNMAIRSVSATTVSSFIYLQPLFAILISMVYNQDGITIYNAFGGILIIFGLWLINKDNP